MNESSATAETVPRKRIIDNIEINDTLDPTTTFSIPSSFPCVVDGVVDVDGVVGGVGDGSVVDVVGVVVSGGVDGAVGAVGAVGCCCWCCC